MWPSYLKPGVSQEGWQVDWIPKTAVPWEWEWLPTPQWSNSELVPSFNQSCDLAQQERGSVLSCPLVILPHSAQEEPVKMMLT